MCWQGETLCTVTEELEAVQKQLGDVNAAKSTAICSEEGQVRSAQRHMRLAAQTFHPKPSTKTLNSYIPNPKL